MYEDILKEIRKYKDKEYEKINLDIRNIAKKIEMGDLIINKNYVIDKKQASKYVESVFMGCVIPALTFCYADEDETMLEVLDGKQRLTSLIGFYNGDFALKGLTELTFLNNYIYSELPEIIRNKYKNYILQIFISPYIADKKYKAELIRRLNY